MLLNRDTLHELLVEKNGLFREEEFARFEDIATENRLDLFQVIRDQGFISEQYFLELTGKHFGLPTTELRATDIEPEALKLTSEQFGREHLTLPFGFDGDVLKVATAHPNDQDAIHSLEQLAQKKVKVFLAPERAIRRALILYRKNPWQTLATVAADLKKKAAQAGETSGSEDMGVFLESLFEAAVLGGASDIHIEPLEHEIIIRFRIDGLLHSVVTLPPFIKVVLTARLKVLASLKIDEHRLPQDGRFGIKFDQEDVDIRLSILPALWGEKAVMRLLLKEPKVSNLSTLGFLDTDLALIKRYLQSPYGLILVCGPTGSGKTSTLYACLQEIGLEKIDVVNVSTVEDPIEYTVSRVTQVQVQPDIDFTFAAGLRALLRQDPDIIMVGEIRDTETADIAVRASLTGRLLLSSLHTNNAVGAIPRLLDMGVEPYLVSSTLELIIAQRLIRKLCLNCRESHELSAEELADINAVQDGETIENVLRGASVLTQSGTLRDMRFFRAKGCSQCGHTGYRGRTGAYEVLTLFPELRESIKEKQDVLKLSQITEAHGHKTLFIDGLAKAILGVTDLKEVFRVTV